MLYFVSTELSLYYSLFAFLSAVGVLQAVAARYHLDGLALLDYAEHPRRGYLLGALLVLIGASIYFGTQWAMIFTPGPAGAELTILFGIAALIALLVTLALAQIIQSRRARRKEAPLSAGQPVTLGPARGWLYVPTDSTTPLSAVCLLPACTGGNRSARCPSLAALVRHLLEQRIVVLWVQPDAAVYTYPAVLAVVPAAVGVLTKMPQVDPQRIGVLGHDVGGDLAIRAGSVDRQIKAVVALAPMLIETPVSLDLLREMPYLQALRWARDRCRIALRSDLRALEYGVKIAPRPLLLVYGSEDRMSTQPPVAGWGAQITAIHGAGHLSVVDHPLTLQAVPQWFKEYL